MATIDGIYMNDNRVTTSTAVSGKDTSQLDMNDFMNLLVAQMTNQDMMNPVSDTEFIAQMAQFSSLQGIQNIQEYQLSSYASSYAGKYVTIANQSSSGSIETITGKVDAVTFYDGSPKVIVNGKGYDLHTVMEVSDSASAGTLHEASQYIGQTVTVSYKDDMDINREYTGKVTGVTVKDNIPHLIIEGADGDKKEFPLSALKSVDKVEAESGQDGDGSDGDGSDGDGEGDNARARMFRSNVASEIIEADTRSIRTGQNTIDRDGSEDWTYGVTAQQIQDSQVPLSGLPTSGYANSPANDPAGNNWIHQGYSPDRIIDTRREINDMYDYDSFPEITYSSPRSYERVQEINDMGTERTTSTKEDWPEITYSSPRSYERVKEINDM